MEYTVATRPPLSLRLTTTGFLCAWMLVAAFPLAWVAVMSFKLPIDAFSASPLAVILGPRTLAAAHGVSVTDMAISLLAIIAAWKTLSRFAEPLAARLAPAGFRPFGWCAVAILYAAAAVVVFLELLPIILSSLDAILPGFLTTPLIGATFEHYRAVWIDHEFTRNFENSMIVTAGVVTISLSVGTLAGYALARTGSGLAFVLLIVALVFRALPQSVLVTGYLPVFIDSAQWLKPVWDAPVIGSIAHLISATPPTLYGKPWAIICVLVSINQPFTIWMLRSFFRGVPAELDEAARVDGCSYFEAFRRVIMPVMWPGVVTAGLFSFLLAYNDYLVCALLLDAQSQTMVPAITQYFNRETTSTDQIEAVAAAVSITAPLFLLVMVFQRQIVSGLTSGAVKG
jgi:multiple sugar transport system permease protein